MVDTSENSDHHPVWDVYDEYRTARLNVKCHIVLLRRYRLINFCIELALAISAPSSAVAGLFFWDTPIGAYIWKSLGIITAFLAVAKPLMKTTEKIRKLEEIVTGYRALDHDLQSLTIAISQEQKYDKTIRKRFDEFLVKKKKLITSGNNFTVTRNLQQKCETEVLAELPPKSFYIPEEVEL